MEGVLRRTRVDFTLIWTTDGEVISAASVKSEGVPWGVPAKLANRDMLLEDEAS